MDLDDDVFGRKRLVYVPVQKWGNYLELQKRSETSRALGVYTQNSNDPCFD